MENQITNQGNLLFNNLSKVLASYQNIYFESFKKLGNYNISENFLFQNAINNFQNKLITNPEIMINFQIELGKNFLNWTSYMQSKLSGQNIEPPFKEEANDKRFKHPAWQENLVFSSIKDYYLMLNNTIENVISNIELPNEKEKLQIQFLTKQYLDSISPTNCPFINPEVLQHTIESSGENLLKGVENLLYDLNNSDGILKVSNVNKKAFKVGENIATSKGKVIYRNRLIELIYYEPVNDHNYKIPLLIIPPWINKYYIFDLNPQTSFVKWCLEHNYPVYIISWKNPTQEYADIDFADYITEGVIDAIKIIQKYTKTDKVNTIGYCIGGTLLSCTIAYLKAKKKDYINSATFFATAVDFSNIGVLSTFIDEHHIADIEKKSKANGYYDGTYMAHTFNLLRANEMIWQFVINNYYLGKEPIAFDLLYWNADSTNMPLKMQLFYLKEFFLHNNLVIANKIKFKKVQIDLGNIDIPCYILSAKDDHIVPWQTSFLNTKYFKGMVDFVLCGSGHVAGIFNHPNKNKYCYWRNLSNNNQSAEEWFNNAAQYQGSWWDDWNEWLSKKSGNMQDSIKSSSLPNLFDAPGTYVFE